ncbi:MAG: twin-arginine translocation pathway signal [Rhodopirellula sp.]|nr:twin-arginine translocation pathway signal [Rhodopirellula sp.]
MNKTTSFNRRTTIKSFAAGTLASLATEQSATSSTAKTIKLHQIDRWDVTHNRVWLGAEFWSNPMEDWRVHNGWVQSQTTGEHRSIHSVTRQLTDTSQPFGMSVELSRSSKINQDGGAGFKLGVKSDLNEYRSNMFSRSGIIAGIIKDELAIGDKRVKLEAEPPNGHVILKIVGIPTGKKYLLKLTAFDPHTEIEIGSIQSEVPASNCLGNISLVSQFTGPRQRYSIPGYRFRHWLVGGLAITHHPDTQFGPILWTMYTLSDSRSEEGFVLKLSALTGPLGKEDNQHVELQIERDGGWQSVKKAKLHADAWTATFRIPNWNERQDTRYRVLYVQGFKDGASEITEWSGVIQKNPKDESLRLAALTCQNDYGFPYEPVASNIVRLNPHMLYFSGDQLYEGHGGYGIIRDPAGPAILNYLRKFYQFGWAFREAMRNAPVVCLPDDHDVFQGNIWGEGGAAMKNIDQGTSSKGGYREPARMVNTVHITNCAHHPDYFDPTPSDQGISVYYGDLVYGGVSFAILGDRQFKSGPEKVETGSGRADHVRDPDFDTAVLDEPGLILLGRRQEDFLSSWSNDWRGHNMKVLLSQTVFAGVATHHGGYDGYLKADLDSGGWPQSARNNAIDIIRSSMALHINGDQHLTSLVQYGVRRQRDSNWSFCTPAIAAGYPRWWRPDDLNIVPHNRPQHGLANTGEYVDGFGNMAYVYAAGNPEVGTKRPRYERAHQKGSGFGFVIIDTVNKTYEIHAYKFAVNVLDNDPGNEFPGWPITIQRAENKGKNKLT